MAFSPSEIRNWTIYRITNPNGRHYIGKTVNMKQRLRSYKCDASTILQPLVYKSFKKYGMENHDFEIIDNFTSDNEWANGKEMFWIRSYMSNIHKFLEQKGMNLTDGGDGTLGFKKSEEERAAMVVRYTGRMASEYQKKIASEMNMGNKYALGVKHTEEWKIAASNRLMGNKHRLSHTPTEETREKLRIAKLGTKDPEDVVARKRRATLKALGIPIIVFDRIGNVVAEYECQAQCARDFKMDKNTILSRLKLGDRETKKGVSDPYNKFIFKYK